MTMTAEEQEKRDRLMDKEFERLQAQEEHQKRYAENEIDPYDEKYQKNFPINEKRSFERTPTNLRAHFVHRASPLIDDYINAALGDGVLKSTNDHARFEVWSLLKTILLEAKNPAPLADIRGKTIEEQVDKILTLVSKGKINLEEGKEYLSLVQQGFEVTEIPKMMQKLETLESLGVL